ncbi:molecular chaperone DnaK [Massilia sp. Root351]|uniref:Hsp70 family protein n=1 Tax=Massilia sp. Root351 TaxID=1736522 RepID=UPI00070A13EB|nr:Hsp70 family protein [Massilia sp. Root351]KQV85027.1 molecular chaperone DnaK [Massilia sp. Root351]
MKPYLVSIDLGTTNTVLAYCEPGSDEVKLFDIDQLVAPGEIGTAPLLPSLRYHPAEGELAAGELQLPWREPDVAGVAEVASGRLARKLGAQVPGRLVASAKSWLSHPNVDRMAAILPWGAEPDVAKVSPVAASAGYLAHLRAAWNQRFPKQPLEQQQIVLTIPASFDEGARALTLEAARMAGLPKLRLLEEPQAAFYDWLYRHRATLAQDLAQTRLVLVCDVGGGTTDFSLIKVELPAGGGDPLLTRIGVGNHLILGGDNMDLALARRVEARLAGSDAGSTPAVRLSAARMAQLTERCRAAKEQLLAADAPDSVAVTMLGSGSKLVGGSRSVELTREEVEAMVVDGFFPLGAADEEARRTRGGIVEFGLPYASDPAITRHLSSFLHQHAAAARAALGAAPHASLAVPDTLLLNGGVFRADALAARLEATLSAWRGAPVQVLHNDNPDVAVARGGVAYAIGKQGRAPTIGGGSPRSYFLLLDSDAASNGAASGAGAAAADAPAAADAGDDAGALVRHARRAVCILPRGAQAGSEVRLAERTFALRLGRPVRFHIVSSTADSGAAPSAGELVELDPSSYVRLPPIATVLRDSGDAAARKEIPVQLAASLSEVGTLEVHCVASEGGKPQRWLLEFQLRAHGAPSAEDGADEITLPPRYKDALERIERIFGSRAQQVDSKEVRQLGRQLDHLLGARESWPTPLLRHLFDALLQRAKGRRRSAEHERAWLNLAGYCLRPGFGHTLDAWRIEQLWAMFDSGLQHHKDSQACSEWWTLWRRVSGGLDATQQLRLLDDFAFNLQADEQERGRRPVTLVNGSEEDMLRLGASLERIPSAYKGEIGEWLLGQVQQLATASAAKADKAEAALGRFLWALGRVGSRQPFHGSAHDVAPVETVEQWLAALLTLDWKKVEPAGFAAAHLARMTGDRTRDISEELRAQILQRMEATRAPAAWSAMVREVVQLDQAMEKRMLGEALPPGLKLLS